MDVERLIEEVRKLPSLYDQKDEKYRNTEYKNALWKKIAAKLKAKGGPEECKKKWISVRDQLRRSVIKRKTATGSATVFQRKYKYEYLLQFLMPLLLERETISNAALEESRVEGGDEDSIDPEEEESNEVEFSQNEDNEPGMASQQSQEETITANTSGSSVNFARSSLNRKMQHLPMSPDQVSSQLMTYTLPQKNSEESTKHPVDDFLAGIAHPLKSLNPILLNQAKSRIFSVVQEFEMKQLMASGSVSTSYTSPREYVVRSPLMSQELAATLQQSELHIPCKQDSDLHNESDSFM